MEPKGKRGAAAAEVFRSKTAFGRAANLALVALYLHHDDIPSSRDYDTSKDHAKLPPRI